jgi:hypothetical protein
VAGVRDPRRALLRPRLGLHQPPSRARLRRPARPAGALDRGRASGSRQARAAVRHDRQRAAARSARTAPTRLEQAGHAKTSAKRSSGSPPPAASTPSANTSAAARPNYRALVATTQPAHDQAPTSRPTVTASPLTAAPEFGRLSRIALRRCRHVFNDLSREKRLPKTRVTDNSGSKARCPRSSCTCSVRIATEVPRRSDILAWASARVRSLTLRLTSL